MFNTPIILAAKELDLEKRREMMGNLTVNVFGNKLAKQIAGTPEELEGAMPTEETGANSGSL